MNLAEELIKISETDLKSAEVLYRERLYPQAVFYFQQSVEKANKGFGFLSEFINEKELKREVGHKAIKIYIKTLKERKKDFAGIKAVLKMAPGLEKTSIFKGLDIEKYKKRIDKALSGYERISSGEKRDKLIHLSSKEIKSLLKIIEEFYEGSPKFQKSEMGESELKKFRSGLIELFNAFNTLNPEASAQLKRDFEQQNIKDLKKYLKPIFKTIPDVILTMGVLLSLSIITLPHSTITRYPDNSNTPSKIYTKKLPLIKMFPRLIEVQATALKALKRLITMRKKC